MRTLNQCELALVAGGDNPSMGPYEAPATPSGAACGNAILVWVGIGSGVGSLAGGLIGFFAGAALGGWGGTLSSGCKTQAPNRV